jgi:hypothetical protein
MPQHLQSNDRSSLSKEFSPRATLFHSSVEGGAISLSFGSLTSIVLVLDFARFLRFIVPSSSLVVMAIPLATHELNGALHQTSS